MIIKKTTALILTAFLLLTTMCACSNSPVSSNSGNDAYSNQSAEQGNTYLKWVGRFNLEKIELNGSIFYAKDFEETTGWPEDQYILLNQNLTGKMAMSCVPGAIRTVDISYSYDIAEESGYIHIIEYSEKIRFEMHGEKIVFDYYGATWTFKK